MKEAEVVSTEMKVVKKEEIAYEIKRLAVDKKGMGGSGYLII